MRRHRILPALAVTVVLAASACTDDGSVVASGTDAPSSPSVPASPSATSATPSTASPPPAPVIEDGRHFVFVKKTKGASVTFDLAEFYTGEEADQISGERGDEVPVPNDVYIVNDNPKLRTVPVADAVVVNVYDWSRCCEEYTKISFDQFAGYIAEPTDDFLGTLSPYWLRVQGGEIVKIEEQYLP